MKPSRLDLAAPPELLDAERRKLETEIPALQSRLWHIRAELKRRRRAARPPKHITRDPALSTGDPHAKT